MVPTPGSGGDGDGDAGGGGSTAGSVAPSESVASLNGGGGPDDGRNSDVYRYY